MGGKTAQSSSAVSVPQDVLARYQSVNNQAQTVAQTPFQQYSNGPNAFVAPLNATQQAGVLGSNLYSNTAQPFYQQAANMTNTAANSLSGAMGQTKTAEGMTQAAASPYINNIGQYLSPYMSDVIAPTTALMEQQFNQAQSGQLGNAINNGAFGGDRAGIVADNLQQQQGLAYGQTIGNLLNQNWSQALGAAQAQQQAQLQGAGLYGQQAGQFGNQALGYGQLGAQMGNLGAGAQAAGLQGAQAQLAAGQAQQQTNQAGLSALYNQFLQQQSYPFQTTQFLANIAEGTGGLSGSTTSASSPAPFFSDERLKENIKPIGETYDGQGIYRFGYKGRPETHIGLIAQEVERKHPEAVGLAGGFRTVDYDAATRDAAEAGRDSRGGEVIPFPGRRGYSGGGLAPDGFILDPSFLQAQQEGYNNAPWAGVGATPGLIPYGGKSHVPPSGGGSHAQLAPAKPPPQQPSGIHQLAGQLKEVEGLAGTGKSAWELGKNLWDKGTAKNDTSSSDKPAPSNDASGGDATAYYDLVPDMTDFASRGGLVGVRRHRDSGGAMPVDYGSDDESDSGTIPYKSGTHSHGLNIPDNRPINKLATSNPPSSGSGSDSGLSDVLGIAKTGLGIASLFGLKAGGRVGLAGGGVPDDIANMPIPDLESGADPSWPKAAGLIPARANEYRAQAAPTSAPVDYSSYPGRIVHPTVEVPDKTPGLQGAEEVGRGWLGEHQDMAVPAMRALGRGLLTALSSNSRYGLVGVGQGLGAAMDEFGGSYEDTQNQMIKRGGVGAGTVGALANAGQTQATTGQIQTQTVGQMLENEGKRQALSHGDLFSLNGNDYVVVDDGSGHPKNILAGQWLQAGMPPTYHQTHTAAANAPAGNNVPPAQIGLPPPTTPNSPQGSPNEQPKPTASYGSVGPGGMKQADIEANKMLVDSAYRAEQKSSSKPFEDTMGARFDNAVRAKQLLNQSAENLAKLPASGPMAPGALNALSTAAIYRWNGLVTAAGHPELATNQNEVGSALTQQKLQAMQDFSRADSAAQHAYAALELANHATAGASMDKKTIASVLSSLYIDNQQDIDKWHYLQDYKNYIASSKGTPFSNLYSARNAMTAWANDNQLKRYGPEEQQLESIFNAVDQNGVPLISRYQKGLSPKQLQIIEKKYPGIMQRYFGGGNG